MGESVEELQERYGAKYRWLVSGIGLCGSFAMVLSATIANVAVPHVMGSFGIGIGDAQWIATAFITAMTVSQLLNHWMVQAFGQRGAFHITIIVFLIGSALGWFAPNLDVLILGRVLQGFAAGVMQPLVTVTMFSVFPSDRRGLAMGIFGAGILIAPGVGPTVGGLAIDTFDWRFIFLMPLPFCLVAFVGGLFFMPGKSDRNPVPPFDWLGYGLLATALAVLMTAAANGVRWGWASNEIIVMFTCGFASLTGFVIWQLKSRAPLLDFNLWRNARFSAALCVAFTFGAGIFAISYLIPVFVQTVQGYSATQAGLVMLPAGLLLVFVLPITGRVADKIPYHVSIMIGLAFFAVGAGLMSVADVNTPFWTFAMMGCISQFGLAFIMPSLTVAALSALPASQLFRGSGNVNFIRQLGGAVGTNLMVVWLQVRTVFHGNVLTDTQTADNETSRQFVADVSERLAQAAVPGDLRQSIALDYLRQVIETQAFALGFSDSFMTLSVIFILALVPAWIFARVRPKSATR